MELSDMAKLTYSIGEKTIYVYCRVETPYWLLAVAENVKKNELVISCSDD